MRYAIRHHSAYAYGATVELAHHVLHLDPRILPHQRVLARHLSLSPRPSWAATSTDHFGNRVTTVVLEGTHDRFDVTLDAEVEVVRPAAPPATPAWESVRHSLDADGFAADFRAAEFVQPSPLATPTAELAAYAAGSFPTDRSILDAVLSLTGRIHADFTYDPAATDISTPVAEVLNLRRGVCQDFAHLQIAALRALGLAARYVSGYISPRPDRDGTAIRGAFASHAWVGVWCGEAGWIDVDPTNNAMVADDHVVLAWGRDFGDVSPLRGVILGGGRHDLDVDVDVRPLD